MLKGLKLGRKRRCGVYIMCTIVLIYKESGTREENVEYLK